MLCTIHQYSNIVALNKHYLIIIQMMSGDIAGDEGGLELIHHSGPARGSPHLRLMNHTYCDIQYTSVYICMCTN